MNYARNLVCCQPNPNFIREVLQSNIQLSAGKLYS